MQKIFKELSQKITDHELKFSNLKFSSILKFKTEILASLTVALALVPEAVSFSFIAGVHPLAGIMFVTATTVIYHLAIAVICGVIVLALCLRLE